MIRRFVTAARWILVSVGVLLLTSFTIDATTSFNPSQSALGIFAREITDTGCGAGMAEAVIDGRRICFDIYETSTSPNCPNPTPQNIQQSQENVATPECVSQSVSDATPWVFMNVSQAREQCAKSDKRLPTAQEWYQLALGTTDSNQCNLTGNTVDPTGSNSSCVSGVGAFDMIGNVWEWVNDEVINGQINGIELPPSGYVSSASQSGLALSTELNQNESYHRDYFWSEPTGVYAMMRGGFYGSDTDGGIYSVHAEVIPSFTGGAVGFRCVKDM